MQSSGCKSLHSWECGREGRLLTLTRSLGWFISVSSLLLFDRTRKRKSLFLLIRDPYLAVYICKTHSLQYSCFCTRWFWLKMCTGPFNWPSVFLAIILVLLCLLCQISWEGVMARISTSFPPLLLKSGFLSHLLLEPLSKFTNDNLQFNDIFFVISPDFSVARLPWQQPGSTPSSPQTLPADRALSYSSPSCRLSLHWAALA